MGEELKRRTYEALETDAEARGFTTLRVFLAAFILLNLVSVAANTVPGFRERYLPGLIAFEIVAVALISLEFGARVWSCTVDPRYGHPVFGRIKYLLRPMSLVDMISIAPSIVSLTGFDLRFLRMFRLLRLMRVLKLGRYSEGLSRLDDVIRQKRGELVSSFILIAILLTIVSGLMYFAEHQAQPELFGSLPETMWWTTLMLTGEFAGSPVTVLGRMLGMLAALLGAGLVALPAGIIAGGFLEQVGKDKSAESEKQGSSRED